MEILWNICIRSVPDVYPSSTIIETIKKCLKSSERGFPAFTAVLIDYIAPDITRALKTLIQARICAKN